MNGPEKYSARPAGAVIPSFTRRLCILVVKDHADTRRGLEMRLKTPGHRPTVAGDVTTALKAAESGRQRRVGET